MFCKHVYNQKKWLRTNGITATANLDDDATIDTWIIDETGTSAHTIDNSTF
jgi:hypothetical protein